jgi:UDP-perosamine 4-acetyltransferase
VSARRPIYLFGTGGHARVVFDVLERGALFQVAAVLDDAAVPGQQFFGIPVRPRNDGIDGLRERRVTAGIVAIGDNRSRERVARAMAAAGFDFVTAVDPSARIGRDVMIGAGSMVMPGAVVNIGTRIGEHTIINTSASVDHDCEVGCFVHVAPGAHVGGHCKMGDGSQLGIGASVINGIRIGAGATVGAGAAVVRDIPDNVTAVGVPARPVTR